MSITAPDFDYIQRLVRAQAGLVLEAGKEYLAESRLLPAARKEGLNSIEDLVARLRSRPVDGLHRRVVEAMTINETSFFRDFHPFELLRKFVLPDLVLRREAEQTLVIWCAASSSGQEPYSVAMLLREHFPSLLGWRLRIIASDLSEEILARARQGRYSQLEVNRGLPASYLVKYFTKQGSEWQLKDEVRRMVEFQGINLTAPWPPLPIMDIIFMRNVLIYFEVDNKKLILSRVRRLLRDDGTLFLGGAETTLNLDDSFARSELERSGCYHLRSR